MDVSKHRFNRTNVTTGASEFKTIVTNVGDNYRESEDLFTELSAQGIINTEEDGQGQPKWKPWYCKMFHKLGREEVLKRAAIARAESRGDRRHFFSYLLKHGV